jgi:hypothetical protein
MIVQEYQFESVRGMPQSQPGGGKKPLLPDLTDAEVSAAIDNATTFAPEVPTNMRIHSPDPTAPPGSSSAEGWTVGIEQVEQVPKPSGKMGEETMRMTAEGEWFEPSGKDMNLKSYERAADGSWVNAGTGTPVTKPGVIEALERREANMASSHIPLPGYETAAPPTGPSGPTDLSPSGGTGGVIVPDNAGGTSSTASPTGNAEPASVAVPAVAPAVAPAAVPSVREAMSAERVEQGLSPFTNSGFPAAGSIDVGSGAHIRENLNSAGALSIIGSVGMPLISDIGAGKSAEAISKNASKNLASTVGGAVEGDMLKLAGLGKTGGAASTIGTINTAAKMLGAPQELTGSVDAAMMPLSPVSTTLSEGAGAWHSILQSGASAAAGDANWDKALMEHQEEGVKTASPFQPLYWAGEALSGGWDDLSRRMIGKEGQSGEMGTFVEAGNYWADVMFEEGKFSRDMSDIGSFMWEGASGEGGIKGGLKAGREAVGEAGSYWKNVLTGKGNLMSDLGEIGGFIKENATAENALSVAEGITKTVGGDWLLGKTREASDYWGDIMMGEGNFGRDMAEIGSYMWGGESGKGGIKGAALSAASAVGDVASDVGSSIAGGAEKAWDWATSWW